MPPNHFDGRNNLPGDGNFYIVGGAGVMDNSFVFCWYNLAGQLLPNNIDEVAQRVTRTRISARVRFYE
jgi:hypothetical protein